MDDRTRWDEKYRGPLGEEEGAPDPFVVSALERIGAPPAGRDRALDVAAGTGRHALELARRGWKASAWDVSPVGLDILAARARDAGVDVVTGAHDLVGAPWPAFEPFDLVLCVLFLDRDVFARLRELVAPGGHLVFATATVDRSGEKPPRRFRLERGELAGGVPGLETLHASEVDGWAGIVARK